MEDWKKMNGKIKKDKEMAKDRKKEGMKNGKKKWKWKKKERNEKLQEYRIIISNNIKNFGRNNEEK